MVRKDRGTFPPGAYPSHAATNHQRTNGGAMLQNAIQTNTYVHAITADGTMKKQKRKKKKRDQGTQMLHSPLLRTHR